jgi:hypothetical protein
LEFVCNLVLVIWNLISKNKKCQKKPKVSGQKKSKNEKRKLLCKKEEPAFGGVKYTSQAFL